MSTSNLVNRLTRHLVSSLVGLVRELSCYQDDFLTLGLAVAAARPAAAVMADPALCLDVCGGVANDPERARLCALMEFAERYGGLHGAEHLVRLRVPVEQESSSDVASLLFAPWQYRQPGFMFKPIGKDQPIRFIRGYNLSKGKTTSLPLALVRVPFLPLSAAEHLCCSTSSGLAAGFSRQQAMLSGLLELCERDAFMQMWLLRKPVNSLDITPLQLFGAAFSANLQLQHVQCRFFDLTNDLHVPVVMCMLCDTGAHTGGRRYSIGVAARSDFLLAAEKAFYEAAGERLRLYQLCLQPDYQAFQSTVTLDQIRDFSEHSLLYTLPDYISQLDALWQCPVVPQVAQTTVSLPSEVRHCLRHLLLRFNQLDYDVYVVPLDTPETKAAGIRICRMLIPELIQLNADHRSPFYGSRRLWQKAGFSQCPTQQALLARLNPLPHPLA